MTTEEQAEYAGYWRANKFVAALQRQARRMLGFNVQDRAPIGLIYPISTQLSP